MHRRAIFRIFVFLTALSGFFAPCCAAAGEPSTGSETAQSFSGRYLSGLFAHEHGDQDAALGNLKALLDEDPTNAAVAQQLQALLLAQGQVEAAVELTRQNRDLFSQAPLASLLKALGAMKEGDFTGASRTLRGEFESGQGHLWVPLISAWADMGRQLPAKPMLFSDLQSDHDRTAPLAYYHLALINDFAGFPKIAADHYRQAIPDAANAAGRVIASIRMFIAQHPGADARLEALVAAFDASRLEPALEDPPAIKNARDGVAEVLLTMGSLMLSVDATQDAVAYLQLALYMKPDFALAALTLGDALSSAGDYAGADAAYGRIPAKSPWYAKTLLRLALNQDRAGHGDKALADLDVLSLKFPAYYEAHVAKGDLLRMRARFADAADAYSQAMEKIQTLRPFHWPILFARGACYERMGNWSASERDLLQALSLKPDQPDVLNYLGYSWIMRGERLREGRDMIEKALAARPNNGQIVDSMGWALYLLGDYEAATGYLEKAVALLPADATVNEHLGDLYWRMGRRNEARFQWERALQYVPDTTATAAIERKLREGLPPLAPSGTKLSLPVAAEPVAPATAEAAHVPDSLSVQ